MAIYDINGNESDNAYSLTESVDTAYDLAGNIIYDKGEPPTPPIPPTPPEQKWDYSNYTITTMYQYSMSSAQAFSIYDGKIAQIQETTVLHIIDIDTGQKIKQISNMNMGHGNSCQFSDEFYIENDEFPIFYERNSGVWAYRIYETSSILVRKYNFPTEQVYTYVAGFGIDSKNRKFYTASYTEGDYISKTGLLCICEFDMDDLTYDAESGTYTMALLRRNSITWFDKYQAVQGSCYHDGYFFIATGYTGGTSQNVVLVDVSTLTIAYSIPIDTNQEIEGCAWVDDDYLVVGQKVNTYSYKKIEFAPAPTQSVT